MKKELYILIFALSLAMMTISCDKEPSAPPEPVVDYITIAQLRGMHVNTSDTIRTNLYIQGVITLSPELGNLPNRIAYIQDSTAAICIASTETNNTMAMNSEVKILCNGGILSNYSGLLQLSNISIETQVKMVNLVAEIPDPDTVTIAQLLTDEFESRYVYVPGSQFEATGTFHDESLGNTTGTSRYLTDCSSEIAVFTRSDASFAGTTMPTGNGTLKGIASIYNSRQIILRETSDLDMTGNRCGEPSSIYWSQDFSTATLNANISSLTGWYTYSQAGTKAWYGSSYSSNYFAKASAYGSNQTSVITWMIAPSVDLASAVDPFMTFETIDGFDNGATLQLFVSTDYDGTSATPWNFTWIEHSFVHSPSNPSGYNYSFTSSGVIDLSSYVGNTIYIALVYTGEDNTGTDNDKTTTWEVDNIVLAEE